MSLTKIFCVFALILSLGVSSLAQLPANQASKSPTASNEEKEKARLELEKKAFALAERIASDAATLKLAENRAYLLAMSGDLLWKQDQKRARSMFQNAATELIVANAEAEKNAAEDTYGVSFFNSPRRAILQAVARRDADLALELLTQTRPPRLVAEMQKQAAQAAGLPVPKEEPAAVIAARNSQMQVQEELRLEQSIATMAAENDPKRAARLIRESMTKGVTFEVLNSVRKLHQKDAELGNSLLVEVGNKLLESDLSKERSQERSIAINLLRQFGMQSTTTKEADSKKQPLRLPDTTMRDLANKIADGLMKATNFTGLFEFSMALPMIEKFAPERAAALKQKQAALRKTAPEGFSSVEGMNLLNQPDVAPEKLIAEAAKMPAGMGMRGILLRRATAQLAQKGEYDRARQLISEMPAGKERDDELAYIDSKLAEKAVKEGKYDEARKLIGKIGTKGMQIQQLVGLALAFNAKADKDSKEAALKIMDEARGMVDVTPQNDDEIADFAQIIAGYAVIEPREAFALLTPLVDQTNELVQAAALLAKYNKRQFLFRDGEMLLNAGLGQMRGNLRFTRELGLLAAADFERTRELADKFQRTDVKLLVQLLIAQSVLRENQNFNESVMMNAPIIIGE